MNEFEGFSNNLVNFAKPCPNPYCFNPNCKCGFNCQCTPERPCGCSENSPESDELHESVVAAIEEMRVWVRLMAEHAQFIRMGIDPNPEQEQFFRQADQFAIQLAQLHNQVISTPNYAPTHVLIQLREHTIILVNQLIRFKRTLFQLLESCQALATLPAILVDHVRREADRFVGSLERSKNFLTKDRKTLGIPNGNVEAETMPRFLYHRLPKEQIFKIGVEETAFFSRIHSEHAHHLSMSFRPEVQEEYRKQALFFEREFKNQITHALDVENTGTGWETLLRDGVKISTDFHNYLKKLLTDITSCAIPTKGTNFPPLIADHMDRETIYYMDILDRLKR